MTAQDIEHAPQNRQQLTFGYRGSYRHIKIHPCIITIDDLRKLYVRLSAKSSEALEVYLRTQHPQPGQDHKQFEALKDEARRIGGLSILILGSNGEQILDTTVEALSDEGLPDKITRITLDSASALRGVNVSIPNHFLLTLDFTEPPNFYSYDPWDKPTPNDSHLEVSGPNTTWVAGVQEEVLAFIKERKKNRAWLHSQTSFNILNWLFAFPSALWVAYRVDGLSQIYFKNVHIALKGAFYVYLVLITLLGFRVIMASLRWTFPVVELQGARSMKTRTLLITVCGSLVLSLFYDALKTVFG